MSNNTAATAHDAAKYILQMAGKMSTWRLQKLLYYSQAWSLVWDERPLFAQPIEAWANGPVVPIIYAVHKGRYDVEAWPKGSLENLDGDAKETIDAVLKHYGQFNTQQLSDLTHAERPWKDARIGIPDGERGSNVISLESMAEYYGSL